MLSGEPNWAQATPGCAFCSFLSRWPGAPNQRVSCVYGPQARAAVPALLRKLATNVNAAEALKAIDPEAAVKAGVK